MKYIKIILIIALLLLLSHFLINSALNAKNTYDFSTIKTASIGNSDVNIELAITNEERERGLSFRSSLPPNDGLFFVFEKPGKYGFWMKDMNFPIDIIWIDKEFKILDISQNVLPSSYPNIYMPSKEVLYVLEVNAGFASLKNIKIGDTLNIHN